MRFREILLLVVLVAAGFVLYQVETGGWDLTFDGDITFFGLGREYAFEETQTFEGPLPAALDVANSHGWVEIRGTDQETIHLTFKKRVRRRNEGDARDVAGRLHYALARTGDAWSLSTNRGDFKKKNFETGFILTVPHRMTVTVGNSYGPVVVEDVAGAAVKNRHGRVTAEAVGGPCTIETSYEDVGVSEIAGDCRVFDTHAEVRVTSITGDLKVENRYGDVRIEDVSGRAEVLARHAPVTVRRVQGPVSVETSYERVWLTDVGPALVRTHHSPVEADGVRGTLDVHTSYEPVKAANIAGDLLVTAENSQVKARVVGGREISVTTSYENVEISGFSARLALTLRNGNVVLRPSDLAFPMDVRDRYGSIVLYWPEGARAAVQARSRGGQVDWQLAQRPSVEKSNGESVVEAFPESGSGPRIVLVTSYDDIRVVPAGESF